MENLLEVPAIGLELARDVGRDVALEIELLPLGVLAEGVDCIDQCESGVEHEHEDSGGKLSEHVNEQPVVRLHLRGDIDACFFDDPI